MGIPRTNPPQSFAVAFCSADPVSPAKLGFDIGPVTNPPIAPKTAPYIADVIAFPILIASVLYPDATKSFVRLPAKLASAPTPAPIPTTAPKAKFTPGRAIIPAATPVMNPETAPPAMAPIRPCFEYESPATAT